VKYRGNWVTLQGKRMERYKKVLLETGDHEKAVNAAMAPHRVSR